MRRTPIGQSRRNEHRRKRYRFSSSPRTPRLPIRRPAATVASTPEKWRFSASRNEPYAATAVSVACTKWSEVRPASATAAAPQVTPTKMPPPVIKARVRPTATALSCELPVACAQVRTSANKTAATPSLKRLSLSTKRRRRPLMPVSLNMARTAIGSVAAISTPKTTAGAAGQAKNFTMPAATTTAEMTTPSVESTTTGSMSCRSSRQRILSAASNKSGGRMTSKMKSCVSISTRFEPRQGKTLPGKNEPYRVWQTHAPGDDRDDNSYAEEANGMSENCVHRFNCSATADCSALDLVSSGMPTWLQRRSHNVQSDRGGRITRAPPMLSRAVRSATSPRTAW